MNRSYFQRMIAIGDVHGCSTALRKLIKTIQPRKSDTIIFLGDVIDYGPDSRDVIEQILDIRESSNLILIAGNHEEMLLGVLDGTTALENWLRHGGNQTLESYRINHPNQLPEEHVQLLRSAKSYHETDTHLFVHANYYPNLPLAETPATTLFWEFCDPAKCTPHYSGKMVIVGHTPQTTGDILDLGFLIGIDTDASRGGWLTALDTETGEWWQADEQGYTRKGCRPHLKKGNRP